MATTTLKTSPKIPNTRPSVVGDRKKAAAAKRRVGKALKGAAKLGSKANAAPTEPTASDIAEREAIARTFFNPVATAAAHAAFLARKKSGSSHGK